MVRIRKDLTGDEFAEAFPDCTTKINLWNDCIDESGYHWLDRKKYGEHILKCHGKRKQKKAIAQSKKSKKGKI